MQALANLPSKGFFSNIQPRSRLAVPEYIADHDTSPPADQVIQTDQTNILIRALTLKKKKEDTTQAAGSNKGKRPAPGSSGGGEPSAKRANNGKGAAGAVDLAPMDESLGGGSLPAIPANLNDLSVKRLRELCTAHGLEAVGTKEQLKAKLRGKGKQAVGGAVAKR